MKKNNEVLCSFCGKTHHEVRLVIEGPEPAHVCDECVDLCVEIIYERGYTLPSVNERLGRRSLDLIEELGTKPRFAKVRFQLIENQCFYLCPFSEPFDTVYRDHVLPVIEGLGMSVKRADDIYGTQPIVEDIWEGICESEIIIADVTGRNPNVMYEIGLAHSIGKPVVIVTQDIADVPFDLRHYRCIVYEYTPKGIRDFERQLLGTTRFLKKRGENQ